MAQERTYYITPGIDREKVNSAAEANAREGMPTVVHEHSKNAPCEGRCRYYVDGECVPYEPVEIDPQVRRAYEEMTSAPNDR